tara:strand:- start:1396 stop:2061 length:666 start_codon:yes stop_codon:yes gene_type:complete
MATVKVVDLINRAEEILQDTTNVRWSQQTLLDYLNDGQREVVLFRPDANPVNESLTLAANSAKQSLPATALRLLSIYKNASPTTKPITNIERRVLDDQIEDWHGTTGTNVEHYVYDPMDPKVFYVYPHTTSSSATISIVYSSSPANITISNFTSDTTVISLDDVYANAILDYMLYRAYQKDTEYAGDMQRAGVYLQSFQNSLGVKNQVDAGSTPRPSTPAQ